MSKNIILKAENISKQYRLGQVGTGTISHDLNRLWHQVLGKDDPYLKVGEVNDRSTRGASDYVWALQGINFEVERGEVIGIIGKNGAGKSTLLKILSKVTAPTTGVIKSRGRIASLLEVGTGFNPELTGKENIYLNGAILGMTKKEITSKLDEIIDFSGCERYIDTPVKRYSSGMTVRLAFAVAAFLEPEILVVDEVLAVGDAEFQKKAIGKMQDISRNGGRTVLFVSHNLGSVKTLCNRGILLENGKINIDDEIDSVLSTYQKNEKSQSNYHIEKSNKDLYLKSAKINAISNNFNSSDSIPIVFEIYSTLPFFKSKYLLISVLDNFDQTLFSCEIELVSGRNIYELELPSKTLVKGSYKINSIIYHPAVTKHDVVYGCCNFFIIDNTEEFSHLENFNIGKLYIPHKWQ